MMLHAQQPNKAASGNGAVASRVHFGAHRRDVRCAVSFGNTAMIRKTLMACRGEAATRLLSGFARSNIRTVVIYTQEDCY